jgi:hypothetical protein
VPEPAIPGRYLPLLHGVFSLRGGPLCGYGTDLHPRHKTISLVFLREGRRNRQPRTWLCAYVWNPVDAIYDFAGMGPCAWG